MDSIERALVVIQTIAWVVALLSIPVILLLYEGWHQKVPVAIGVAPFCVAVGAGIGLWLMGRGEFPGGGN